MTEMPTLITKHLIIRPFIMEDLEDIHQLLDIELKEDDTGSEKMETLSERSEWLQWCVLNYKQLAKLNQPPYGDRAIVNKQTAQLIGSCGFVPCLNAFEQCPNFSYYEASREPGKYTAEFGLYYAILPNQQRHGFATEANQTGLPIGAGLQPHPFSPKEDFRPRQPGLRPGWSQRLPQKLFLEPGNVPLRKPLCFRNRSAASAFSCAMCWLAAACCILPSMFSIGSNRCATWKAYGGFICVRARKRQSPSS